MSLLLTVLLLAAAPFARATGAQSAEADSLRDLEARVSSALASRDPAATARSLIALAQGRDRAGQGARALEAYRSALGFARGARDPSMVAEVHNALGLLHFGANRYDSALVHLERARELRTSLADSTGLGRVLNTLGATYYQLGAYEPALDAWARSLVLRREAGDVRGTVLVLANIGKTYHDWRQLERARSVLEEAVTAAESLDAPAVLGYALNVLGMIEIDRREFVRARALLDRSLVLYGQAGGADSTGGWALNTIGLGILALREGKPEEALATLRGVHAAAQRNGSLRGEARALLHLGQAHRALGDRARAIAALTRSLELSRRAGQRMFALDALAELTALEEAEGSTVAALAHLRAYQALRDTIFDQSASERIVAMESRARVERQRRENSRLLQSQRDQALVIARQRTVVVLGAATLALAAALLILLVRFNRKGRAREALLARTNAELGDANRELRSALGEVRTLKGLIPICAHCKKVRDDRGFWEAVETYVSSRSEASFSHGICSTCGPELYGELWEGEARAAG